MRALSPRRSTVAVLALVGLSTALYLTMYQLELVSRIWDPFSLDGSEWVLRRSPLVRWLGFPDAAFGVALYGSELFLELRGVTDRARTRPWPVLALGGIAAAMAGGSLLLTGLQAAYGHWCSLCLVSAMASVTIAALVFSEVTVAARCVYSRRSNGQAPTEAKSAPGGSSARPTMDETKVR
ncbi:MAG: vitamin K epoxide reductase family protein [Acidimicrobiales bacterium]